VEQDSPQLFTVTATTEPQPKFQGDLMYGAAAALN